MYGVAGFKGELRCADYGSLRTGTSSETLFSETTRSGNDLAGGAAMHCMILLVK